MKKVSVIVPCYNVADYLGKCVEQLLRQTIGLEFLEIILVDDASTDGGATWEMISMYERQYSDNIVAIALEQNMRQGGARNVGISYASGKYVIFCDADDWLSEVALEHCYQVAEEFQTDVVEFLIKDVENRDAFVQLEKGNNNFLVELDTEEKRKDFLIYVNETLSIGSQKKFYRLSLIKEHNIKFVEHSIFEEPSFMIPVRLYEKRHYFLDERLYICYVAPGSSVRSDWGEHRWDNPKVWMDLMYDLSERGFLNVFHDELEYLFWGQGYSLTISLLIGRGYILSKEEWEFLVKMTQTLFPNIRNNKYVKAEASDEWNQLLTALLDVEIKDENVPVLNDIFRSYLVKCN